MTPHIAIDVRMMHHSGIGTYLKALVPRMIAARPEYRFTLIGSPSALAAVPHRAGEGEAVQLRVCHAPIYGITEQLSLTVAIPRDVTLYWAPHYNIPVLYRGRLMVTIHDVAHLALPQFVRGVHRRAYARAMYAAVRRAADALLCDSDFTAQEYARLVGIGRAHPITVHLGVDDRWFEVERECRPHARPYFLFVGNVKPNKNVRALIRAFALARDAVPHDLVIVGKRDGLGTGDPEAARAAAELGDRVHFAGFVDTKRLEQFVAFADALVMPSWYEGFGLPPLEAMAARCPVIVSRAASLPEVCGDAALYFDPASHVELAACLTRLATDESLQEMLRARGTEQARRFRWNATMAQTLAVVDRLVTS
jgi:glycosyltransferase involved in cell wall biosynthesis